jgi:hypothetical protein
MWTKGYNRVFLENLDLKNYETTDIQLIEKS